MLRAPAENGPHSGGERSAQLKGTRCCGEHPPAPAAPSPVSLRTRSRGASALPAGRGLVSPGRPPLRPRRGRPRGRASCLPLPSSSCLPLPSGWRSESGNREEQVTEGRRVSLRSSPHGRAGRVQVPDGDRTPAGSQALLSKDAKAVRAVLSCGRPSRQQQEAPIYTTQRKTGRAIT